MTWSVRPIAIFRCDTFRVNTNSLKPLSYSIVVVGGGGEDDDGLVVAVAVAVAALWL